MLAFIDKEKHWFVVRTTVKGEEKAFENIRKAGYDTYYPRRRIEVQHRRTKTYVVKEEALMPRYLFVGQPKLNPDFYRLRNCDGVEGVLGVDGRPIRISHKSVNDIYLAEIEMDFDDTRAARIHRKEELESAKDNTKREFPAGRSVFVTDQGSPFATFGGVVEEVTKSGKVIALMELFGRMTAVQFDGKQLTPA